MKKLYLAGPDVFLPNAKAIGDAKKSICARFNIEGLFPLDNEIAAGNLTKQQHAFAISAANEKMMRQADAIFANITPWHGPSLDVGTAFEIGFMRALDKPIFLYSNISESFFDRVSNHFNCMIQPDAQGIWRDNADKSMIEHFGLADNLMIEGARAHAQGFTLIGETSLENRYTSLVLFEQAMPLIKGALAPKYA